MSKELGGNWCSGMLPSSVLPEPSLPVPLQLSRCLGVPEGWRTSLPAELRIGMRRGWQGGFGMWIPMS